MVPLMIGGKYQSTLTGKIYRIKSIKDQMVVLESEDGLSQVLTNRENMHLFYSTVPRAEDDQMDLGGKGPFSCMEETPQRNSLSMERESN